MLAVFRKHDRWVERSRREVLPDRCVVVGDHALRVLDIIYGVTGSTRLSEISARTCRSHGHRLPVQVERSRTSCRSSASAFKVSAVPFHFWAPDTYEGAPTPVTVFLSVASKAGGFVALINIIYFGFLTSNAPSAANSWWPVVWVLAVLSMTLGNLGALRQTNIVRMLAYSSIAEGGFMLVPLVAAGIEGASGDSRQGLTTRLARS